MSVARVGMTGLLSAYVGLFTGALISVCRAEQPRPNVLLIYTDDQGTVDAGCYGSRDLQTPNIDRLARTGVRFTQMYAPSAICSASRAGLMTGRFPARAGVPGNVSSMKGVAGMPTTEITIAEVLKQAGYATGHVGKWHLGYTPDTMPNGQGFDDSFGHMGGCIDNYSHFFYWNGPNRHDLWRNGHEIWEDGQFFGDLMVRECKRFIGAHRDESWFLYWAINEPHYPLQPAAKWREAYRKLDPPRSMYGAFVSTADERIGVVLDYVEELGQRDNTIVVFQSDHGHSTEVRTFGGGGSAGPYRGAKGCLFEGGIRIPSVVSWPAKLPRGEVRGQMVVGCDWLPTIAEWCGASLPKGHAIDGRSIGAVIRDADAPSPHDTFYWRLGNGAKAQWVVRQGDWKLLGNPRDTSNKGPLGADDRLFLVNLSEDASEMRNMAKRFPEKVRELQELQHDFESGIQTPR